MLSVGRLVVRRGAPVARAYSRASHPILADIRRPLVGVTLCVCNAQLFFILCIPFPPSQANNARSALRRLSTTGVIFVFPEERERTGGER